ncbi:protein of unknown function [Spirosoma fluviale]|uniref:DUF4190 domain-containing protein n=2 Tax=Spirosoma fluviale TaxID=1597977 RepID=A0A286G1F5_9BACT|nr:protein of unknown function [Spirosoma fluviale]
MGGLTSCQRAPTAYFAPTYHPAPQRLATSTPATRPIPDSLTTASLTSLPAVSTRPIWEEPAAAPADLAIATNVHRPTLWRSIKHLLPRKPAPPQCDQIVLRNGDVIEAKVKEVGVNEIRYKKCDRQDGPDYTISKRDVLSIKYSNGEVERFTAGSNSSSTNSGGNRTSYDSPTSPQNDGPRTDPFAIVAISAGGLAIFTGLGSLLLGAAAVVFGALSLSRIRKEPNRFKGKGLAMAGMIIGIVAAAAVLLYVYVL